MKLKAGFLFSSLLIVLAMLVAACGSQPSTTTPKSTHNVLRIGGFVGDAFTKITSPYNGNANVGTLGFVYEPLFYVNLNDGKYTPLLGQSYSWNSDSTQLTVNLRQGVKWNDGQAFSSADVAYTFNTVLKEAKGVADTNSLWSYLSTVTATDANTVQFTFSKAYTPVAYNVLAKTYIVPQHVWSTAVTNPATDNPPLVGTGPYTQSKFSASLLVYTRNTNYWNNSANKIDELDYPAIKDNATLEEELISGQLDWGSFGADSSLQTTYVDKDSTHNKYWFSSSNIVGLYLNDSKAPFNDVNVRQAISAALDRSAMSTQAENGFESPANSAGVVSTNSTFLQPSYASVVTAPALDKVSSYLTASGYAKVGGFWEKNGQKITVKYNVPSDWSDWVAMANIIKQNLQAAGIDGEVNAISDDNYFTSRSTGSFDAMIGGMFGGPTPYYLYQSHLNSNQDATKGGWNWGHYKSAAFDALLNQYAGTSDATTQTTLINQMEDLFAKEMPIVPLLNAANWYEYSTKHYTGWPSADNPYALGPDYDSPGNEIIITHLTPAN